MIEAHRVFYFKNLLLLLSKFTKKGLKFRDILVAFQTIEKKATYRHRGTRPKGSTYKLRRMLYELEAEGLVFHSNY